jgi:hypothetical protein
MAILKGYADDSKPGDRIWAVAGYLGNDLKWECFEEKWPKLLAKHDVPYLHMKEIGRPNGPFAKWHPLKEHNAETAALFSDVTDLISECWLTGFWSIVRLADLDRFNSEMGMSLEPYPLAAYGCLLMIANEYGNLTSEIFFDRADKIYSKLEKATSYAESDSYYGKVLENVGLFPLQKGITARELAPLQIADFFTWELQRNHLNADDWHSMEGRPRNDDQRWLLFEKWAADTGLRAPRKSLEALMKKAAPVYGIIWDYDQICSAHHHRGGVWEAP